jgi:Cd2+/Zn2+-exporting ATPase
MNMKEERLVEEKEDGHCHEMENGAVDKKEHCHGEKISCGCGHCHEHEEEEEISLKKLAAALALFVLGLVVEHVPVFKQAAESLSPGNISLHRAVFLGLYFASYLLCGKKVLISAVKNISQGHIFDEQFLMSVASLGAVFTGEIAEAVAVMLFYNIGEFFQDYAVDKSRRSISALLEIRPDRVFVLRNGKTVQMSPEDVEPGEIIQVKPGERAALDGIVEEGSSFMDTSALTGESVPRKISEGDTVLAGFISTQGVLNIRVTKKYGESAVSRILELTQKAGEVKAKSEKFITRFARVYTPAVCILALLVALIPPAVVQISGGLMSGPELSGLWHKWIYRALMFLVVSCPCALVISVPLSFFSGIGLASRHGILIKGSNFVEALSKADTAVFDKTGTLTKGIFAVTKVFAEEGTDEDDLIAIAAHAEYFSNHPISKSLKDYHYSRNLLKGLDNKCCEECRKDGVQEIGGHGIKINLDGICVLAGNEKLMEANGVTVNPETLKKICAGIGGTVVHVAGDGKYRGAIIISDQIKEDSLDAVRNLKKLGIKQTVMLTGDNAETAALIACDLGIDKVFSGLLPEDKVSRVEDLIESKNEPGSYSRGTVMFAGDGINDSPVLACADIGIAMGAMGSDAAIEAADVVIMDDKPSRLVQAIKISRSTMRKVYQNIWISLGVKALIMITGALGITDMWAAVFGDVGVTFLAVLNALRLL